MKSIIISVINDLATDQRVQRMSGTILSQGYNLKLVGRKLPGSMQVELEEQLNSLNYLDQTGSINKVNQVYKKDQLNAKVSKEPDMVPAKTMLSIHRFRMLFKKGPFFYAFFNLRLFFYLIFRQKPAMLVSVDLDTLLASYLVSRFRHIPLLYDSHEYFTEVPELVNRPGVKKVWERIEKIILPRVKAGITVSDSIAAAYREKYAVDFRTIRNVPVTRKRKTYTELQDTYPSTYKIIYQGALNKGRGIELMIETMRYMNDTLLFIVGDGDVRISLQNLVHRLKLTDRVIFPGRVPPVQLAGITAECDLGLSLEEDLGLNYRMALPNKIFDYIQAGIPVLCSDLPEMATLVKDYGVGEVCRSRLPRELAGQIREMLKDSKKRARWNVHIEKAVSELCWEKEEKKLIKLLAEMLDRDK